MSNEGWGNIEVHGGEPEATDVNPDGVWTLYEGRKVCTCHVNWQADMPSDVQDAMRKNDPEAIGKANYALVLKKRRVHNGKMNAELYLESVTIHSELLKPVIKDLFGSYSGITLDADAPVLEAPFMHFFHFWDKWKQALEKQENPRTLQHMRLLDDIMSEELAPAIEAQKRCKEEKIVTWRYLWILFDPRQNQWVYWHDGKHERLYKLDYVTFMGGKLNLYMDYLAWNGRCMKVYSQHITFEAEKVGETANVLDFRCYPIEYHVDAEGVKERLYKRGKQVLDLAGVRCRDYRGSAMTSVKDYWPDDDTKRVNSRIVIDAKMFRSRNECQIFNRADPFKGPKEEEEKLDTDVKVGDQVLRYMEVCRVSPYLRGYSLTDNEWLSFDVDLVREPKWNTEAFSRLSLPDEFRELVQATVEMQLKRSSGFDDFVSGKGQGFVILLSGPPGVGKTATIETIAETLEAPLYVLSASKLGTSSRDIESALKLELEVATRWNAVVLLDEADIFLERRDSASLERNAIITVFLRQLEYHRGVLCLTTNRADSLDDAIYSRCHLSLRYEELDRSARNTVWRQFVEQYELTKNKVNEQAEDEDDEDDKRREKNPDGTKSDKKSDKASDTDADAESIVDVSACDEDDGEDGEDENDDVEEADEEKRTSSEADDDDDEEAEDEKEEETEAQPPLILTDEEYDDLASVRLDGRQIKNAFKTAVLLAEWKKQPLDYRCLRSSVSIVEKHMMKTPTY